MTNFIIALAIPFLVAFAYVLFCGALYICGELIADIKKAKRRVKQGIWDLEWKWNLWKKGLWEWLTR